MSYALKLIVGLLALNFSGVVARTNVKHYYKAYELVFMFAAYRIDVAANGYDGTLIAHGCRGGADKKQSCALHEFMNYMVGDTRATSTTFGIDQDPNNPDKIPDLHRVARTLYSMNYITDLNYARGLKGADNIGSHGQFFANVNDRLVECGAKLQDLGKLDLFEKQLAQATDAFGEVRRFRSFYDRDGMAIAMVQKARQTPNGPVIKNDLVPINLHGWPQFNIREINYVDSISSTPPDSPQKSALAFGEWVDTFVKDYREAPRSGYHNSILDRMAQIKPVLGRACLLP